MSNFHGKSEEHPEASSHFLDFRANANEASKAQRLSALISMTNVFRGSSEARRGP